MLSIHGSSHIRSAIVGLGQTSRLAERSSTRLATGFRVNTAQDDAAGLQIATRLKAQNSGTQVAIRNMANDISLLQTAMSAIDGMVDGLTRMRELAIQAADGSSTNADITALQAEFDELHEDQWTLVSTKYAGEYLWVVSGGNIPKLASLLKFQTGASQEDQMEVNFGTGLAKATGALGWSSADLQNILRDRASEAMEVTEDSIEGWGMVRSNMAAVANRLEHAINNAMTLVQNTSAAVGRIMDTDYAEETAENTKQGMLTQSGGAMLKAGLQQLGQVVSLIS